MGSSVDGKLSYGAIFNKDTEFPWNKKEFGYNIDDWWLKDVLGWKPPFKLYDENGEYVNPEITKGKVEGYYNSMIELRDKNPIPVGIAYYGFFEYMENDEVMLTVGKTISSYGGEPTRIDISILDKMVTYKQIGELVEFCKKHLGCEPKEIGWFMTANYG